MNKVLLTILMLVLPSAGFAQSVQQQPSPDPSKAQIIECMGQMERHVTQTYMRERTAALEAVKAAQCVAEVLPAIRDPAKQRRFYNLTTTYQSAIKVPSATTSMQYVTEAASLAQSL